MNEIREDIKFCIDRAHHAQQMADRLIADGAIEDSAYWLDEAIGWLDLVRELTEELAA